MRLKKPLGGGLGKKLAVFTVSFGLMTLVILTFNNFRINTVSSRQSEISTGLAKLDNAMFLYPSPDKMRSGIINSEVRNVSDNTTRATEDVKNAIDDLECSIKQFIIMFNHCRTIGNSTATLENNLSKYSEILNAMTTYLEYNSRIDTSKYSPGATATTERMDKLSDGLDKTLEELQSITQSKQRDDMIEIIQAAQSAQERLLQTNQVDPFVLLIEKTQEETIKQLAIYFESTMSKSRENISEIMNNMPK